LQPNRTECIRMHNVRTRKKSYISANPCQQQWS
jgi:hypothetical protein